METSLPASFRLQFPLLAQLQVPAGCTSSSADPPGTRERYHKLGPNEAGIRTLAVGELEESPQGQQLHQDMCS